MEGHIALFDIVFATRPTVTSLGALLAALVEQTGLHAISEPAAVVNDETGHWTAIQIIAESHVALSGVHKDGMAEVFSCRWFDADAIAPIIALLAQGSCRLLQYHSLRSGQ